MLLRIRTPAQSIKTMSTRTNNPGRHLDHLEPDLNGPLIRPPRAEESACLPAVISAMTAAPRTVADPLNASAIAAKQPVGPRACEVESFRLDSRSAQTTPTTPYFRNRTPTTSLKVPRLLNGVAALRSTSEKRLIPLSTGRQITGIAAPIQEPTTTITKSPQAQHPAAVRHRSFIVPQSTKPTTRRPRLLRVIRHPAAMRQLL